MKTAAKNTPGMRTRTVTPAKTAIQIPNLVILTEVVNLQEEPQVQEALEGGGDAVSTPPLVFSTAEPTASSTVDYFLSLILSKD